MITKPFLFYHKSIIIDIIEVLKILYSHICRLRVNSAYLYPILKKLFFRVFFKNSQKVCISLLVNIDIFEISNYFRIKNIKNINI